MAKTLKEIRQMRLKRVMDAKSQYRQIVDSTNYQSFRKLFASKIADISSTEEAIDLALESLKNVPAEHVVTAVIETLADVIDRMYASSNHTPEPPADPTPEPPADPESIVEPQPEE